jgi:hypothetical protein
MLPERNYKSLLLAALLIGAVGTAYAWENCGTNLEYEIDGTILRFNSPDPTQPAVIMTAAFKDNTTITSFTLPENVWQIGSQAFMGCTNLATVELSNVQDISTSAFEGCTSLDDVVIPPTVTNIGVHAFYGCTGLHNVLCRPYAVPTLGTDAFTKCNPLAESGCYADLLICVPALGTYKNATNWSNYYDNLVLTQCEFLDESDEQSNTEAKINAYRTASLTDVDIFRTLRKAGCFNTLTLPFNVPDISASPLGGDNVEVYEFVGAEVLDGALQLDIAKVTSISLSAGTPYLIQWNSTGEVMTRLHFSGITAWDSDNNAESTSGNIKLHGFYGKTHINDATDGEQHLNLFLQGGNQLYWPTDGSNDDAKMLGFRAWFQITGNTLAGAPIRRDMPASLRIVQTPTDINPVTGNPSPVTEKVLRNGQIIIIRNGEQYSITGQKL